MKFFEEPNVNVEIIELADVITTSGEGAGGDGNVGGEIFD